MFFAAFMKASGDALISKIVGHEQMITAMTLNSDAANLATCEYSILNFSSHLGFLFFKSHN